MSADFLSNSAVRNDDGKLKMMFRGDYRADALRDGFKIVELDDGGSGGLYFTDNAAVASSYANNKPYQDEDACEVWKWINVTLEDAMGKERTVPLARANIWLSRDQKAQLRDVITKLSETDDGPKPTGEDPLIGQQTYDEFLARNRNNHVATMIDLLHSSGMLDAEEFVTFVEECGVFKKVVYNDPYRQEAVVTPVYLDIRNPLSTVDYPTDFFHRVEEITGRDDQTLQALRDTTMMTIMETVTFITPEFRNALLELGYDGIVDVGGRNTDTDPHTVYIALSPEQIVPAYRKDAVEYRNAVEHELTQMTL